MRLTPELRDGVAFVRLNMGSLYRGVVCIEERVKDERGKKIIKLTFEHDTLPIGVIVFMRLGAQGHVLFKIHSIMDRVVCYRGYGKMALTKYLLGHDVDDKTGYYWWWRLQTVEPVKAALSA